MILNQRNILIIGKTVAFALVFASCGLLPSKSDNKDKGNGAPEISPTAQPAEGTVAIEDGELAGTAVAVPPGTLGIGSSIDVKEGAELAIVNDLSVDTRGKPVAVDLTDPNGQQIDTVTSPLTISLNIPSGAALQLQEAANTLENLCVLLDARDGNQYVWYRNVLKVTEAQDSLTLETLKLGTFQVAICDQDVSEFLKDASAEGISGNLRLLASMTVSVADMELIEGPAAMCLTIMDDQGAVVESFGVPIAGTSFKTVLVGDGSALVDDANYSVWAYFKPTLECQLAPAEGAIRGYGPFTVSGAQIKQSAPTGILGDAVGSYPMYSNQISFDTADSTAGQVAPACFEVSDSNGNVIARQNVQLNGATGQINDKDAASLWFTTPDMVTPIRALVGISCQDDPNLAQISLDFGAQLAGANLRLSALSFSMRLMADELGTVAPPATPDLDLCIEIFPDVSGLSGVEPLATISYTLSASADGQPIPLPIFSTESALTTGRFAAYFWLDQTCTGDEPTGTPAIKPVEAPGPAPVEIVAP